MTGVVLRWGVKRSLQEYVRSAGGAIEAGDGAVWDDDEALFPADPRIPGGFRGFVRFRAHEGMLDWTVAEPRFEKDRAELTVRGRDGARIVFATIVGDEARLTVDGALMLGGFYATGTVMDTVSVRP
ncbi:MULTISPECIES: HtaA domain-containing protein [unclassified Microbacterium]|uniref:HtaA domain-containing protein n=1 Tax=unclassified Microbacterium TaxID=2609290 RepID=UPI000C2B7014|nr:MULTISPECIES: HtaA domain-containing protein [unclassified Microbacterium]